MAGLEGLDRAGHVMLVEGLSVSCKGVASSSLTSLAPGAV